MFFIHPLLKPYIDNQPRQDVLIKPSHTNLIFYLVSICKGFTTIHAIYRLCIIYSCCIKLNLEMSQIAQTATTSLVHLNYTWTGDILTYCAKCDAGSDFLSSQCCCSMMPYLWSCGIKFHLAITVRSPGQQFPKRVESSVVKTQSL